MGSELRRCPSHQDLPLDDQTVYHLKVGTDKVTTLVFPQPITALEGSGITADPKTPAKMLLSYHAGDRFFSVRALADPATADLNVIINRKVYVLELATDKEPFQSVTFYPADEPPAQSAGQPNVGPSRLLGLLDKAKAYPLLAEQYPEMVSQIDKAEPFTQTLYEGFQVILTKVFRFDAEDALIFQVEFVNETDQPDLLRPAIARGASWLRRLLERVVRCLGNHDRRRERPEDRENHPRPQRRLFRHLRHAARRTEPSFRPEHFQRPRLSPGELMTTPANSLTSSNPRPASSPPLASSSSLEPAS